MRSKKKNMPEVKSYTTEASAEELVCMPRRRESDYALSVKTHGSQKVIDFCNNSSEFIEVVFTIDGKEVKHGTVYTPICKGYAYPPGFNKPVRKMVDGRPLCFGEHGGEVKAYVYRGNGGYSERDINTPAFLRKRLPKVSFKRASSVPDEVLTVKY